MATDRIKDVLQDSGRDQSTADYRPPGSFPTDDMAPSDAKLISETHQRNKLHKPNDPRGQGHGYSDSGVGLMESSNEPAATKEPVEDAYAPAEGYDQRREHAKRSGVAEFDDVKADQRDTTEYDADPKDLGATAGTTTGASVVNKATEQTEGDSNSHNVVRSGNQRSSYEHKDPYWGDLPQGQGTYNTVAGHGSSSDEARRHHEDTSEQRTFPLVTDRTRQHHQDPTEKRFEEQREPQRTTQEEKKDSHWKEGTAGAAAAGVAGTAAYKATRDDEDHSKYDDKNESAEEKEKKKSGGLFGLFHRDHKDKDEKDHSKDEKKEKHHHKEEKVAPVAAAGYASRDDKRQDEQRYDQTQGDNLRSTRDPAVAAAAMAYSTQGNDRTAASNRGDDVLSHEKGDGYNHLTSGTSSGVRAGHGESTTSRDPVTSTSTRGGDIASHEKGDGYNHLASGTSSGVRAGHGESTTSRDPVTSSENDRKDTNRNAAVYGTAGTAAALGAGGYAAHELRKDRDDEKSSTLNKGSTTTREETPRSGNWFTTPATTTTTTSNTTRITDPAQSQRDTFTGEDSSRRTGAFVAAPIPDMHTRDPAAESYPSATGNPAANTYPSAANTGSSEPAMRQPSSEMPRVTEEANQGQYNKLQSGTPSGVNVHAHDSKPAASSLPTVQDEKSNRGAMATAGLAAAGAGTGAAYYATRDDGKHNERSLEKKPVQKDTYTTTTLTPAQARGEEKVTHKCVRCGEENDITQYLKEKVSKH